MPLRKITLTDDQKRDLVTYIESSRTQVKTERSEWEQRLPQWRRMYEGHVTPKDTPWPDAANVTLDVVAEAVDDTVARTMDVLLGDQKWAPVAPVEGADDSLVQDIEGFMQWALQLDMKAWGKWEAIVQETCINGTCFVYISWDRKVRKTLTQILVPVGKYTPDVPDDEIILKELGTLAISDPVYLTDHWEVRVMDSGEIRTIKIWIEHEPEHHAGEIVLEIERETVVKECPRLTVLEPNRVWATDVGDIAESPFVDVDQEVSFDWLKRRRQQGFFNVATDADWEKIERHHLGFEAQDPKKAQQAKLRRTTKHEPATTAREVQDAKDDTTGIRTNPQSSGTRPVVTRFLRYDIDGDGFEEDAVLEFDWHTRTILALDYLNRRYPHGRIPVVVFRYRQIANRLTGIGLPEILFNMSIMINTLLNQTIDAQQLAISMPFIYDKTMFEGMEAIQVRPGKGIPALGDPTRAMHFPAIAAPPFDRLLPIIQLLQQFTEARSGKFSVMAGGNKQVGAGTGFPRTFGGTNMIMREGMVRIQHIIKHFAMGGADDSSGFNELLHQVYDMYMSFYPVNKKLQVLGPNGIKVIERTKRDMPSRADFMFSVNMLMANPAVRQANALLMWQSVLPLLTQRGADPQVIKWLERLYRAYDVVNPGEVTPSPLDMVSRAPMPQRLENELLLNGIPVDVLPTDNDLQHIQELRSMMQDFQEMGVVLDPRISQEIAEHEGLHMQQLMSKQAEVNTNTGGRPMGTERRMPGQPRPMRAPGGGGLLG